jgi:hypothetical protein
MLYPALEDKLRKAKVALEGATSDGVIELCKQYLALLDEYRSELYTLPRTFDLHSRQETATADAEANSLRKAVRSAIEETTRERERAEALILSFTAISGYAAVETFNRLRYRGRDDWTLSASGASFTDGQGVQKMTMQEAVETASLLRREEYVAGNAAARSALTLESSEHTSTPSTQPVERNR